MRNEPQIFTSLQRQDQPVDPEILMHFEDERVLEVRQQIRGLVKSVLFEVVEVRRVMIDGKALNVEVVDTPKDRARGLMGRQSIGSDGMLFVLEGQPAAFHMRNTYIPLDIVYFDTEGVVIKTDRMKPKVGRSTCSQPTSFALELAAGDAKKFGVRPGSKLVMERRRLKESYDDVVKVKVRVRVNVAGDHKPTVTDILTDIRAIPNVVTANQAGPRQPAPEGKNMATLDIGFIDDAEFGIRDLQRGILATRGVDMFRIVSYNGQPYVSHQTEALIRQLVNESLQADN